MALGITTLRPFQGSQSCHRTCVDAMAEAEVQEVFKKMAATASGNRDEQVSVAAATVTLKATANATTTANGAGPDATAAENSSSTRDPASETISTVPDGPASWAQAAVAHAGQWNVVTRKKRPSLPPAIKLLSQRWWIPILWTTHYSLL